jgi:hypothetical protein
VSISGGPLGSRMTQVNVSLKKTVVYLLKGIIEDGSKFHSFVAQDCWRWCSPCIDVTRTCNVSWRGSK